MTTNTSHIRPMKFSRFEVERCIRVLQNGNGFFTLPIDSRQDENVLELIAPDIGFPPNSRYELIETAIDGQTFAMIVEADRGYGALYVNGDYGGVWWRVVGFEDGFPNEPFVLATTDCEDSAKCTCMSLQLLLEPTRVAVRVLAGEKIETVSDRPAEVLLLSETDDASDDDEESPSELNSASPWAGIKPTAAIVVPEKIHSLWDQSR
jgi:hypothetical protein